jgi:hypothetical protein
VNISITLMPCSNALKWRNDLKSMLKEFYMLVAFCGNCPHSFITGTQEQVSKYSCGRTYMAIENPGYIPEWCPLPDKEFKDER